MIYSKPTEMYWNELKRKEINMEVKNGIYLCDVMGCFCFVSRGKVTDIKIDKEK